MCSSSQAPGRKASTSTSFLGSKRRPERRSSSIRVGGTIPKLKASPKKQPAFDLVLTDATQGYPAIREGLFQNIDLWKIPNKANFVASALDNWVVKENYGITFPDSVMTLGYNKTMVPTPPTNWGDLLRDEFKGKLGMYNSFYMSLYTFACMKVAQEVADNLQGVIDFAKANRDRVKLWWPTSTDMALNLTQKNCALGNMHGTDMIPALKNSADLGAVVPKGDRAFVLLMWVVAAGTKVKDLAQEAINMLLSDEVQAGFAAAGGATAIPAVAAKMAAQDKVLGRNLSEHGRRPCWCPVLPIRHLRQTLGRYRAGVGS